GHHDADTGAVVPGQRRNLVELAVDSRLEHFHQVRLEPHQQGLALRVAEADVVFQDLGTLVGHDETGVEHSFERRAATLHGVNSGDEDFRLDLAEGDVVDN